jgi:hypothetical protein
MASMVQPATTPAATTRRMMPVPGAYRVAGRAEGADGTRYSTSGTLTLTRDGGVMGMLTDGPLAGGNWDERALSFLLLYNGSVPFLYTCQWRRAKDLAAGGPSDGQEALLLRAKGQVRVRRLRLTDRLPYSHHRLLVRHRAYCCPRSGSCRIGAASSPLTTAPYTWS